MIGIYLHQITYTNHIWYIGAGQMWCSLLVYTCKSNNGMCEKLSAHNNREDNCYQIFQIIQCKILNLVLAVTIGTLTQYKCGTNIVSCLLQFVRNLDNSIMVRYVSRPKINAISKILGTYRAWSHDHCCDHPLEWPLICYRLCVQWHANDIICDWMHSYLII